MMPKLLLSDRKQILLIPESDIVRVHGDGSYCTIYALGRRAVTLSRNLAWMERQLKSHFFLRVHQSHLVNISKICAIDTTDGCKIQLEDGSEAPVSRRRKELLLTRLRT